MTERRRLEEQLRQAQKMEAVGQLAGGVAHDFNNLLTAILGYCQLLLDEMPEAESAAARSAGDSGRRRARGGADAAAARVQPAADAAAAGRRHQHAGHAAREAAAPPDQRGRRAGDGRSRRTCCRCIVDPASVEQILVNLAVNARDAMPTGGRLTIETANVEIDDSATRVTRVAMKPGPYVMLAVGRHRCRAWMPRRRRACSSRSSRRRSRARAAASASRRLRHRQAERRLHLGLQRARARHASSRCICRRRRPSVRAAGHRPAGDELARVGDRAAGRRRRRRPRARA